MNVRIRFVVYKQKNDAPAKQIIRFYLIWILRLMNFTESTTFNITRETCGPGFAYPSSAYSTWDHPRLFVILIYLSIFFIGGIRVAQSLVSHVVFCKILFVFFFFVLAFSVCFHLIFRFVSFVCLLPCATGSYTHILSIVTASFAKTATWYVR